MSHVSCIRTSLAAGLLLLFVAGRSQTDSFYLLKPQRVFDGEMMHTKWVVLVKGDKIVEAGEMNFQLPANTRVIEGHLDGRIHDDA
jgi:hypothetical protein